MLVLRTMYDLEFKHIFLYMIGNCNKLHLKTTVRSDNAHPASEHNYCFDELENAVM